MESICGATPEVMQEHLRRFKDINDKLEKIDDSLSLEHDKIIEINGRVELQKDKLDNAIRSCKGEVNELKKKVEKVESQTEAIVKLTMSVDQVVKQNEEILENLRDHNDRLNNIEKAPGILSIKIWSFVLSIIVASLFGILFAKIGG